MKPLDELEAAKKQKLEQYQHEMEAKKKEEQVKSILRMALSENAYGRLMNVKLANAQLYAIASNQIFGLYQKSGRKLTEKELIALLKAIKGTQRETKITFKLVILMSKHKSSEKKKVLGKKTRQNKRMPVFVTVRTKRKVRYNNRSRNWRTDKIGDVGD